MAEDCSTVVRMTRILIADDHEVVRSGVRGLIGQRAGWSVVAEAADGEEAIDRCVTTKPDVAILDYSLPRVTGVQATRQILAQVPTVEVLIFTLHDSEMLMRDAFNAGARGYLLKTDPAQNLLAAIEALAAHRPYFTGKVSEALLATFLTNSPQVDRILTNREQAVVQLVAEGHSNKEIAQVLSISVKTVETHRAAVMRKLEIRSTAEMVRYAVRNKLVGP
jgi:DNA-binding NarL/FixJ family response regulator